jgi:hypothetical protein
MIRELAFIITALGLVGLSPLEANGDWHVHPLSSEQVQQIEEAFRDANADHAPWKVLPQALVALPLDGLPGGLRARVVDRPTAIGPRLCRTTVYWLWRQEGSAAWTMEDILDDYHASVKKNDVAQCDELNFEIDYFRTPVPLEDHKLVELFDYVADRPRLLEQLRGFGTIDLDDADLISAVKTGSVQQIEVQRMWPSFRFAYAILLGTEEFGLSLAITDPDGLRIVDAGIYYSR